MEHVDLLGYETETRPGTDGRWAARPAPAALTAAQAACIEALREGAASHGQIAAAAGLTRYKTWSALLSLASMRLIEHAPGNRWQLTRRGKTGRFRTVSDRSSGGAGKLGRAARRALRALERPMSPAEFAARLGVSRRQADQLIQDLQKAGRIRLGERHYRVRLIARTDDPTTLLSAQEQRILSAVPVEYATTADKIDSAARLSELEVAHALKRLVALGLVAEEVAAGGRRAYRVTEAGMAHPQYRRAAGQAARPSLPVRSGRVYALLTLLDQRGQAQVDDARAALELPRTSSNALFQYLKRKGLIRKDGEDARSPYVLTPHGSEVLAEMRQRRGVA